MDFKNVPKGSVGAMSALVKVRIIGGIGLYATSNSLYNVEGGCRAIVFNRLVGVKESTSGSRGLQMVKIGLRVLTRPEPDQLPTIYSLIGEPKCTDDATAKKKRLEFAKGSKQKSRQWELEGGCRQTKTDKYDPTESSLDANTFQMDIANISTGLMIMLLQAKSIETCILDMKYLSKKIESLTDLNVEVKESNNVLKASMDAKKSSKVELQKKLDEMEKKYLACMWKKKMAEVSDLLLAAALEVSDLLLVALQ
ncbi:hypothetical protein IFM89_025086, partial [Coptis chinensis]